MVGFGGAWTTVMRTTTMALPGICHAVGAKKGGPECLNACRALVV